MIRFGKTDILRIPDPERSLSGSVFYRAELRPACRKTPVKRYFKYRIHMV